jgi:hypothetical protein
MRSVRLSSAAFVLALLLARSAGAADKAAEALYREGRDAAERGERDLACRKFAESHAREPAPGTLLNLANCEERRGQLPAAADDYEAAAQQFRAGDVRVEFARKRLATLERRVARLTVRLDPAAPPGTTVDRDGRALDAALRASHVAPDEHELVVRAPGRSEVRVRVRLAAGEAREIDLVAGPVASVPAPVRISTPTPPSAPPPGSPPAAGASSIPAYVALGIGGAGVAAGAITGVMALAGTSTVRSECPAHQCVSQQGIDDANRAHVLATTSTVAFGVGIVGVAIGSYLLLSRRSEAFVAPAVGPSSAGAVVGRSF